MVASRCVSEESTRPTPQDDVLIWNEECCAIAGAERRVRPALLGRDQFVRTTSGTLACTDDQQRHAASDGKDSQHRRNGQRLLTIGCRSNRTDVDDRLAARVADALIDERRQAGGRSEARQLSRWASWGASVVQDDAQQRVVDLDGERTACSMKPSFLNLFRKVARERVVPTISASVSCEIFGTMRTGAACVP